MRAQPSVFVARTGLEQLLAVDGTDPVATAASAVPLTGAETRRSALSAIPVEKSRHGPTNNPACLIGAGHLAAVPC
jgi:hypothetical protein